MERLVLFVRLARAGVGERRHVVRVLLVRSAGVLEAPLQDLLDVERVARAELLEVALLARKTRGLEVDASLLVRVLLKERPEVILEVVPQDEFHRPEVDADVLVLGVRLRRALEGLSGVGEFFQFLVRAAEAEERLRVRRVARERDPARGDGAAVVLEPEMARRVVGRAVAPKRRALGGERFELGGVGRVAALEARRDVGLDARRGAELLQGRRVLPVRRREVLLGKVPIPARLMLRRRSEDLRQFELVRERILLWIVPSDFESISSPAYKDGRRAHARPSETSSKRSTCAAAPRRGRGSPWMLRTSTISSTPIASLCQFDHPRCPGT